MTSALTIDADGIHDPHRRKVAITAVLAAMALVVLDAAIANIALPTISQSLRVSPASAIWVVTAYQLGLVASLLPASALGESFGYRKLFFAGTILFVVASVVCALSPSLECLVASRFVQGIGGASIMALGIALLRLVVPQHRLGAAIGWNALTVALASAAGPTLGATILSSASWPWLFAVNIPIGALVLAAAFSLPYTSGTRLPVDFASVALSGAAFGLLVIGVDSVSSHGLLAVALLAGASTFAWLLIRRERGRISPLVPLDLLRRVSFRVSVVASVVIFIGQSTALVALPFYLQHNLNLTPLATGLYLLPWPLSVALVGPIAGRLSDKVATSWLCLLGGILLFAGLASATLWTASAPPFAFPICMAICGAGFGLFNVPNNRNMFMSAPPERSGAAGGLQGVARLTGQTFGAVAVGTLFQLLPLTDAPRTALPVGAALVLAAGVISVLRTSHDLRSISDDHRRDAR